MPPVNLLPFWVSTNLQNFGPAVGPVVNLINATKTFTTTLATDLSAQATKAADLNTRLLAWYDAQTQPGAAALQDLTTSVNNYMQDVWESGIHWYILKPSYGGFAAIQEALLPGLDNPQVPDAPRFSDDMYAGGVMLVLAGPPFTLFQAANIIILLTTGRTDDAVRALQDLTADSSAAGDVMRALTDLVSLPETAWTQETTLLKNQFENSAIAKVLGGDFFPLDMLKEGAFAVDNVFPETAKVQETTTFVITGNGFLPSDTIKFGATTYAVEYADAATISITIPGTDPFLSSAGAKTLQIVHKGVTSTAGTVTVLAPSVYEQLAALSDPEHYNVWHSLVIGDAITSIVPGAATFVDKVSQTLDTLGQAGVDAQRLGHTAIQSTGAALSSSASRAANDITTFSNGATDFLAELLSLSASVLIIPPALGGNHQLGYAIGQGLNGFAANSPAINDSDGVMAMFFCAGDLDRSKVVSAVNQVASVLQISAWPTLT